MSRIKKNSYITIMSFMVNDLNLKGNELLIYAIIYGFSQTENQVYSGSLNYLADWTSSSKQVMIRNLKRLVEKGLIIKEEEDINGVKFCKYQINEAAIYTKHKDNGSNEKLTGCCLKVNGVLTLNQRGVNLKLPNNIDNNIEDNIDIDIDIDKSTSEACRDLNLNIITSRLYVEKLFNEIDLMNIDEYNNYIENLLLEYAPQTIASNVLYVFKYMNENNINNRLEFFKAALNKNLKKITVKTEDSNNDEAIEAIVNDVDKDELNEFLKQFE